ncbi:MAG TPA: Clp protease N-terminal domain-containing protein [Gemmataceae bacterium]|jgi:hypothetical protein
MYERFTDRARKVMQLTKEEAQRFGHEFIGTEHILLGLVREGSGVAANVLKNLDIDLRKIRLEVEGIVACGPIKTLSGKLPQTPRAKKVIEYAIEEAQNLNHKHVGTEHLLLGLMREEGGVASQVLWSLGVRFVGVQGLREEVLKLLGQDRRKEEQPSAQPARDPPLSAERERIRSLEQQLCNVRIVLGVFAGALVGALVGGQEGAIWGLFLGGFLPVLGRYMPPPLAGGITGILIGSFPLPGDDGHLAGAALGLLVGILIAVSFTSPKQYARSIVAAVITGAWLDCPPPPYPPAGLCLSGASLGVFIGFTIIMWRGFVQAAREAMLGRPFPRRRN